MKTLISITLLLGTTPAWAPAHAAVTCDSKFDINQNGRIDFGQEIDACTIHKVSETFRTYDTDFNGNLENHELRQIDTKVKNSEKYSKAIVDARALVTTDGVPLNPDPPDTPPNKDHFLAQSGFTLRKAYEGGSIWALPEYTPKISGAQFTYTHDQHGNNNVFVANGALSFYRRWALNKNRDNQKIPYLNGAIWNIGAVFDYTANRNDPTKETDSLTFKTGGGLSFEGGKIDHLVSADLFDATDFDTEKQVLGIEFEYEPVSNPLGLGLAKKVKDMPIFYRFRPVLHSEYQFVADAGDSAVLAKAEDHFFVGPILNAELWFSGKYLDRLSLDATYWYQWDALGNADPFDFFQISANYELDQKGHAALTATYRIGNIPKTREAVDDISVGLTTKF
ncbi:MAG: hypothetical protein NXI27_02030 [Alphaproteobacteria bacterium]|nr:hypothetical protein [Alphaproteobacteria bacterium]